MRKLGLLTAALAAWGTTQAVPNLPLSCNGPLGPDFKCSETSYQYIPGRTGLRVATPSGVWTLWESMTDATLVRVCPQDIQPQSRCTVNRITVPRAQAASDPVATSVALRIRWTAPTRDTAGAVLPAGEVVGYKLSWKLPPSGLWTDIRLGTVENYVFNGTRGSQICFTIAAEGKAAFSDASNEVCVVPGVTPIKPAVPSELTVTEE